jgi:hypothetical protein
LPQRQRRHWEGTGTPPHSTFSVEREQAGAASSRRKVQAVRKGARPLSSALAGRHSSLGALDQSEASDPLVTGVVGGAWLGRIGAGGSVRSKLPNPARAASTSRRRRAAADTGSAEGRDRPTRAPAAAQSTSAHAQARSPAKAQAKPPQTPPPSESSAQAPQATAPAGTPTNARSSTGNGRVGAGARSSTASGGAASAKRRIHGVRPTLRGGYRVPLPAACTFSS